MGRTTSGSIRVRAFAMIAAVGLLATACAGAGGGGSGGTDGGTTITVATVGNPQMKDIQKLTKFFEKEHPDITIDYVVLPENQLREKVTTDIATQGGQFDVVTIGTFEAPLWAERGWIQNLSEYAAKGDYDPDDLLSPIRTALSYQGDLHAVPFYGESSFLMYRKDLFDKAGLTMPENPTWPEVAELAGKLHDPKNDVAGICLRGLPGWGELWAPLNTVVNTFGGRWYDEQWNPHLTSPEFTKAVKFYVDLVRDYGQPGAASSGFTECLTTYSQGKAAMWYDATVGASIIEDPESSKVVGKNGYVPAPTVQTENAGWLWAWALAIPSSSKQQDAAWEFVSWATSKEYIHLAGEELGWTRVPPGTRRSTYEIPEYQKAAEAFAGPTLEAIQNAPIENPTTRPVPYRGIQYVGIPEFSDLGTRTSQQLSAAIAGRKSVEQALQKSQEMAREVAAEGDYAKD